MEKPGEGSQSAARGLVQAVLDGDPDASVAVLDATRDGGDRDVRAMILDALAVHAADSSAALETLLIVVHRHHLAAPAIRRLVIDHHEIEEIEQDVLIAVARSVAGFRSESRFTTWLSTVARNVTIDHLRRQRNHAQLPDDQIASDAARLSSMIATSETIRHAVARLDDDYRTVVTLRDVEQLSYQEIADQLGLNLNTTKSKIYRGRALLAGLLGAGDMDVDRDTGDMDNDNG